MKKYKISTSYKHKAVLWLSLGVCVILTAIFLYIFWPHTNETIINQQSAKEDLTPSPIISEQTAAQPTPIPDSYDLAIPYAPQAPFSNWTVHEESCEEAATYMYRAYLEELNYPNGRIPDTGADTAFRAMKAWQVTNYGKEPDLTMTALGTFAQSYYGYTPTVEKNITEDDIKKAISDGHPVVVPVMTHSLENNMYGPISVYHVLLIKGYDATGVITNDAGVGNGVNKHYNWNVLWQAIDAQKAKMGQGRELLYLTK